MALIVGAADGEHGVVDHRVVGHGDGDGAAGEAWSKDARSLSAYTRRCPAGTKSVCGRVKYRSSPAPSGRLPGS